MEEPRLEGSNAPSLAPTTWSDWRWLAQLVLLVVPLRVWLLLNTEVMARDSVGYIRYALRFDDRPWGEAVRSFKQHPGYPYAIWLASLPVRAWEGGITPEGMQFCAQFVSMLSALLLLVPTFYLGKTLWDARIGFGGALLLQMLPISGQHLSDGLSESLFLLFVAWALLTGVWASQTQAARWFGACGVFAGFAYLTRPEGVLVVAAAGSVLLACQAYAPWRQPWTKWAGNGVCLVAGAIAISSLYMLAVGGISNKPSVTNVMQLAETGNVAPRLPGLRAQLWADAFVDVEPRGQRLWLGIRALTMELAAMLQYLGCVPLFFGLLARKGRMWHNRGYWVLAVYFALHTAALLTLSVTAGYVSDRHLMPLVMLLCYLVALGQFEFAARLASLWTRWRAVPPASPCVIKGLGLALLAILVACSLPQTLKRMHGNREGNRAAGAWLAKQLNTGDIVLDDHSWSHFYAAQVFLEDKEPLVPSGYQPKCFVVITRSHDPKMKAVRDHWEFHLRYSKGAIVYHWPERQTADNARIVIYSVPRDPLKQPWSVAQP